MKTKIFKWFGKDGGRDDNSDRPRPSAAGPEASRTHSGSSWQASSRSRGSGSNQGSSRNRVTSQQGRASSHTSQRDRARDRRVREQYDYVSDSDTDSESQQILERNQEEAENMMLAIALRSSVLDAPGRSTGYFPEFNLPSTELNPAEKQSCTYWSQGRLGYNDKIRDGFYDLYAWDFPEVVDRDEFPSYRQLQGITTAEGDLREVVYVHSNDLGLQKWENQAIDAIAEVANKGEFERIQAVAILVSDVLGGQASQHKQLREKWKRATQKIKAANDNRVIIPIGKLRVGLSCHRALLFKVLCERLLDLKCQLLKGKVIGSPDDTAMNCVHAGGQEWAVDLVREPGRLYPRTLANSTKQAMQLAPGAAEPSPAVSSPQKSDDASRDSAANESNVMTVSTATSPSPPSLLAGASISEWRASLANSQQANKQSPTTSPVKSTTATPTPTSNNTYASLFANSQGAGNAESSTTSSRPVINPSRGDSALEIPSPPRSPTHSAWSTLDVNKLTNPESISMSSLGPNGLGPTGFNRQEVNPAELPGPSYSTSTPQGATHTPVVAYRPSSLPYTSNGVPSTSVGPHQLLPHHSPEPPDPATSLAGYAHPLTLHASSTPILPFPQPTASNPSLPTQSSVSSSVQSQAGINWTGPPGPQLSTLPGSKPLGLSSAPPGPQGPPLGLSTSIAISAQRASTLGASLTYHQLAETTSSTDFTQPILLPESSLSSAGTLPVSSSAQLQQASASHSAAPQYPTVDFYHNAQPLPPAGQIVLTNAQPADTPLPLPYAPPIGHSPLASPFSHLSAQAALELASAVPPLTTTSSGLQSVFGTPAAQPLTVNSASAVTNEVNFFSTPQSTNMEAHATYPTTIPWSTHALDRAQLGSTTSAPPHQHPVPTRVPSNSLDLPSSTQSDSAASMPAPSKPLVSPFGAVPGLDAPPANPSPFAATMDSSAASAFAASALSPTALASPFGPGYSFLEGLSSVSAVPVSARQSAQNSTSALMPTMDPIPAAPQISYNGLNPSQPMQASTTASNQTDMAPLAQLQILSTASPVPSLSQISSAEHNESIPPTLPSSSAGWTMVSNPTIISVPNTPGADHHSQQTVLATPSSATAMSTELVATAAAPANRKGEVATKQEMTAEELMRREALLGVGSFLELDPSEIQLGSRIGIGSYGEVYKGTWGGTEVAVKRFLEQGITPEVMREFRAEVSIMNRLRHPNIVLFMGAVTKPNELAIVTQYVPRGSLFRILHRTKPEIDNRKRLNMALDIARGMHYLHSSKPAIVHRDLKSPNLLVDRDWTIKVCDFGLSKTKAATFLTSKSHGGTPEWMAPEILRSEDADERSDVYSYGVVLYELVTGLEPWQGKHSMAVVGMVGFANMRLPLPEDMEPSIALLIRRCWAHDPRERPSFGEILDILGKRDRAEGIPPCATVHGAPPPPLPSGGSC